MCGVLYYWLLGWFLMPKMTIPELKEWLVKQGWEVTSNSLPLGGQMDWYAYKVFKGFKFCIGNDKPPSVIVVASYIKFSDGREHISCDVQVVGETRKDQWVDFRFYSIDLAQFVKHHRSMVAKLKLAWNAVAK